MLRINKARPSASIRFGGTTRLGTFNRELCLEQWWPMTVAPETFGDRNMNQIVPRRMFTSAAVANLDDKPVRN
jgi:hypothetical protein